MANSPFNTAALAEALRKKRQGLTTTGTTTPVATATTVAATPKPAVAKPTVTNTASPLGNGGTSYSVADLAARRNMQANQSQIKSDPSYVQSETQRALQVIQERQAKGMDTSQQQKYLTTNLGYKGATTGPAATGTTSPVTNVQKGQSLMDQITQLSQRQSKEFSYDPNADPAYQAALKRAQANIQSGNAAAQAEMNRRGILNSTITSDRMGEISSQEMGRVETDVLPSLMQQAYQQYVNQQQYDQQQIANLANSAQMYLSEDQRGIDNDFATADRTGYMSMPAEAQSAINSILSLKQQAETKGISAADKAKLSAQADGYRAQLLAMGIDPSAYASSVSSKNISPTQGARTLAGQQLDLANKQANLDSALQYSNLTGRLMTPQSDWSGYARQAANGNAPLTMAGQQQQFDQGQQAWNNNFALEQYAYQKARDAITDTQWKAQFDENVRQYGLDYGLAKLREDNQVAYQNATLALSEDDNLRQWTTLDFDMSQANGGTAPEYNGMNANQVLSAMQSQFADPESKKIPTDSATKEKIYQQVASYGLPVGSDDQVMLSLGLTTKDIQTFDKKYGTNTGK
ncbi:hypothetical protein [Paenibacillus sp. Marseille-Q4541]|uniref:hypothetical protein n=1 Tax=Paenibacillus sp. Marseille-Q4541 TaxID=2831522 RepID=UPI001BA64851|nr:hypothetical protein [Paenibacillus sp. Marseille-Q4541]